MEVSVDTNIATGTQTLKYGLLFFPHQIRPFKRGPGSCRPPDPPPYFWGALAPPDPSDGGILPPSPRAMEVTEVTKPYEFIGFGAMEVTKPYEFIGFGAMEVTKPYEFIGFGEPHRRWGSPRGSSRCPGLGGQGPPVGSPRTATENLENLRKLRDPAPT
jgi:hypothetical protein